MNFKFTIQGKAWTVKTEADKNLLPPLLAASTTWGSLTLVESGIVPNSQALAHEFYHVLNTNDFRYAFSWTIGRLWGDQYWKNQERRANAYELVHANDPEFVAASKAIQVMYPGVPIVTINHPV